MHLLADSKTTMAAPFRLGCGFLVQQVMDLWVTLQEEHTRILQTRRPLQSPAVAASTASNSTSLSWLRLGARDPSVQADNAQAAYSSTTAEQQAAGEAADARATRSSGNVPEPISAPCWQRESLEPDLAERCVYQSGCDMCRLAGLC